jgi:hypothetical protein
MRFLALDGLRGFFLVMMTLKHAGEALLAPIGGWGHHSLGLVENAQGFVFLSGLVLGMVYLRKYQRAPNDFTRPLWRRIGMVWKHQAVLTLAIFAIIGAATLAVPGTSHPMLTQFPDAVAIGIALGFGAAGGPILADILAMYLVFMIFVGPAVRLVASGRSWLLLAVSAALWVAAQADLAAPLNAAARDALGLSARGLELGVPFKLLAWQILFFTGLVIGGNLQRGTLSVKMLQDRRIVPLVLLSAGGVVAYAIHFASLDAAQKAVSYAGRWALTPHHLLNFAADALLLSWLMTAGAAREVPGRIGAGIAILGRGLQRLMTGAVLVRLGQNALPVYCWHVLAVYLVVTAQALFALPPGGATVLTLLAVASLLPALRLYLLARDRLDRKAPAVANQSNSRAPT